MKNMNQFKKSMLIGLAIAFVSTGYHAPAEAGWKCCKISKKDLKKGWRNMERQTSLFRRNWKDIATLGITRIQREKEEALRAEAIAKEKRDAAEAAQQREIQVLIERYAFVSQIVTTQTLLLEDASEIRELHDIIINLAQIHLTNRTFAQEIMIRAKALIRDQHGDQLSVLELLSTSLAASSNILSAKANEINTLSLHTVSSTASPMQVLETFAKLRQIDIDTLLNEAISMGTKPQLEQLIFNLHLTANEMDKLHANMQAEVRVNSDHMDLVAAILKTKYGRDVPSREELVTQARLNEQKEKEQALQIQSEREPTQP